MARSLIPLLLRIWLEVHSSSTKLSHGRLKIGGKLSEAVKPTGDEILASLPRRWISAPTLIARLLFRGLISPLLQWLLLLLLLLLVVLVLLPVEGEALALERLVSRLLLPPS